MKRASFVAAHVVFAAFQMLSALYCLLAYLPFTYHQVHVGGLIPWLDSFARLHSGLNIAILAVVLPLLIEPWRRGGVGRWMAAFFAVGEAALAAWLVFHPVLTNLQNTLASWYWSLGLLLPLAGLAVVELGAYRGQVGWTEKPARQNAALFATCGGAVFVWLLYTGSFGMRHLGGANWPQQVAAAGWSLLTHLLLFLGAFLVFECLTGLAGLHRRPSLVEFGLFHALLGCSIWGSLQFLVWPALGFSGWPQIVSSLTIAVTLALSNSAVALGLAAGGTVCDGIGAAVAPAALGLDQSWRGGTSAIAVLAVAYALAWQSTGMDWNGLLQKLGAATVWLTSFACFYIIGTRTRRARSLVWLLAPLAVLGTYRGLQAAQVTPDQSLEAWAGYDPSFRLAQQLLAPRRPNEESFYHFLGRNTDIPASVHVDPVSIDLTPTLSAASGSLPNIFIFTIDSLRRDYLSPYNSAVSFTPAIDAFARESTVFRNAFTRYGGTGLSEPSIWSGALLLHKQYITPFAPMNALEKMLRADRYQMFVTRDPILQALLRSDDGMVDLDPPEAALAADFQATLERLQQQIAERTTDNRPIFVYTQPQNLHVSVIQREGKSVPAGESYPGFYAPYAARVRQVDAAFGEFIQFLKKRGLYENSIVVLTADHGDSLGEDGRWGHAYTLYPEIVRIPLLVHLPGELQARVSSDPQALAFSTDITPSLYYLLGHRPIGSNPLFGTPLFTETPSERRRDPDAEYLLASSYGAVYGMLGSGGRRLYVADGVDYRSESFDLSGVPPRRLPLSQSAEQKLDQRIREMILSINRFYRFGETERGRP